MMPRNALLVLCCLLVFSSTAAAQEKYDWSGELKSFLLAGSTAFDEDYWLIIHRFRSSSEFRQGRSFTFRADVDTVAEYGSYLDTAQAEALKSSPEPYHLDMTLDPLRNDDMTAAVGAHRLYARYSSEHLDITLGRQRVAWGTARLWNPTDLFNQVSPLSIEPGEIPGIDALHLLWRTPGGLRVETAAAIGVDDADTRYAVRAGRTIGEWDVSAIAGRFRDRTILGADVSGYIGDGGLRGEIAWSREEDEDFIQSVLSYEYTFSHGGNLLIEYLYNGGRLTALDIRDASALQQTGPIATINRHFIAGRWTQQPHFLVTLSALAIYEIEDGSLFAFPSITWNWKQNIDLFAGLQLFHGDTGDFSRGKTTGIVAMSWFF